MRSSLIGRVQEEDFILPDQPYAFSFRMCQYSPRLLPLPRPRLSWLEYYEFYILPVHTIRSLLHGGHYYLTVLYNEWNKTKTLVIQGFAILVKYNVKVKKEKKVI